VQVEAGAARDHQTNTTSVMTRRCMSPPPHGPTAYRACSANKDLEPLAPIRDRGIPSIKSQVLRRAGSPRLSKDATLNATRTRMCKRQGKDTGQDA